MPFISVDNYSENPSFHITEIGRVSSFRFIRTLMWGYHKKALLLHRLHRSAGSLVFILPRGVRVPNFPVWGKVKHRPVWGSKQVSNRRKL